jgi:hypothetical protein
LICSRHWIKSKNPAAPAVKREAEEDWGRDRWRWCQAGQLLLKRASASRSSGQWNNDDFDVLAEGEVVGRIFKSTAAPAWGPWMWTIIHLEHHKDRTRTHGYEPTREAAMAAFAKTWRRE